MSWRRFASLLAHLPRTSWTVRAVGGDATRWGEHEHLLATVIDVLVQANWMYAAAHSKTKPEMPKPLRRPGEPDPVVRIGGRCSVTPAQLDRIIATMQLKAVSDGS